MWSLPCPCHPTAKITCLVSGIWSLLFNSRQNKNKKQFCQFSSTLRVGKMSNRRSHPVFQGSDPELDKPCICTSTTVCFHCPCTNFVKFKLTSWFGNCKMCTFEIGCCFKIRQYSSEERCLVETYLRRDYFSTSFWPKFMRSRKHEEVVMVPGPPPLQAVLLPGGGSGGRGKEGGNWGGGC